APDLLALRSASRSPRLDPPRVPSGTMLPAESSTLMTRAKIPAPPRAGEVMRMHVGAGGDVARCDANGAPILDDGLAGGDRPKRDFVSARNRFDDGHGRGAGANGVTGFERLERGSDVVACADHDGRRHRFTPLASRPPSTT